MTASRLSSSQDPVIVNFVKADDRHSCEDSAGLHLHKHGEMLLIKKKNKNQLNRNWKSNKVRARANLPETHGRRKDVTRKLDLGKQVQWPFPHLRISGLTSVSGGTHWKYQGWPRAISETASATHSTARGSPWPFPGGPLSSHLFGAVFYFLPCCSYGEFRSCSSTFQSSFTHAQRVAWQLLYLNQENRWVEWKCSHLYKRKPTSFLVLPFSGLHTLSFCSLDFTHSPSALLRHPLQMDALRCCMVLQAHLASLDALESQAGAVDS